MCTVLLPLSGYPIAVKYIYHIISYYPDWGVYPDWGFSMLFAQS